jgi:hypothetical protein
VRFCSPIGLKLFIAGGASSTSSYLFEKMSANKKKRGPSPSGRDPAQAVILRGATEGDVVVSADGTEIRVARGFVKGSSRGCEEWGMTLLPATTRGVGYDSLERCAPLGQGCDCGRAKFWTGCSHPATATLVFLAVGTKIRSTCSRCGTDPERLLQGEWDWRSALHHIKGQSSESPTLQLRRSMFGLEARKGPRVEGTQAQAPSEELPVATAPPEVPEEVPGAPVPGGETYGVPGLKDVRLPAPLVTSIDNPAAVAAGVVPTVTPELYGAVSKLSPSQLKSLLQKLVRWGESVQCEDYDTDAVLACAFVCLVVGKGQFLPELGQHSKGPRLALQRMVISLVEDGVSKEDVGDELAYYAALAAVCQETGALPAPSLAQAAVRMLVRGRRSDSVLDWRDKRRGRPTLPVAKRIRDVFAKIGSMQGDLRMLDAVVDAGAFATAQPPSPLRVPLERLLSLHLDQHSEPLTPHAVRGFDWWSTTGANFRNGRPLNVAKLDDMHEPQCCALAHTTKRPRPEVPVDGEMTVPLGVEVEELAAYCAGQTRVSVGNRTYLCVFAAHDIQSVVVMEKPTRSQEDLRYIAAASKLYAEALHALQKKKISLSRPLEGFYLQHDGGEWSVQRSRHQGHAAALEGLATLPLHPGATRRDGDLGLLATGAGLRRGGVGVVVAALRLLSREDRTEVIRTLSVVDPAGEVHMCALERAASPQGMRQEVYAFIALVAFQCPGSLRAARAAVFAVPDPLCFNYVRGLLFDAAVEHESDRGQWLAARAWGVLPNLTGVVADIVAEFLSQDGRSAAGTVGHASSPGGPVWAVPKGNLRESQQRCAEAMAQRGRRSFVLAPTGSGKTAVAIHRLCAVSGQVDYAFFFIDTISGASAVAFEIESRCDVPLVFLDPRKSKGAGAREMIDGKMKGRTYNAQAAPVKGALNIVIYDHFSCSDYEDFRARIVSVAPRSFAVFDEVDRLYADTKRSQYAVPYAGLFKHLVMMSATALRKQSEHVGPLAAIASLYAPVPVRADNLLVFFAGSVMHFKHEALYERVERTRCFNLPDGLPHVGENTFHPLAEATFTASLEELMKAAREHPPCIIVTESASQVQQLLDGYPEETQPFPETENEPLRMHIVVISKSQGRSTNFGKVCNSMVSVPLASSVATRRQVAGRLTRGPLRTLYHTTVVLEGSVLDFLLRSQRASNAMQIKVENLVALANELEERRKTRRLGEPAPALPVVAGGVEGDA